MRHIGYTMRDADGDTSTFAVKIPDATYTLANLAEFAKEFGDLINAVTDAVIVDVRLVASFPVDENWRTLPVQDCEVQKGALFAFQAADTEFRHSIRIPGFRPSKFAGNSVNTGDADVIALKNALISGLDASGVVVLPSDKYGNDLVSMISAVKSFRKK